MREKLKLAICQIQVSNCKDDNLNKAGDMVNTASSSGAQMVILPEMFNAPYQTDLLADYAESFPGPSTGFLSGLARKNSIVLVGGSIPEKDAEGRIYNCSYTFDEQGDVIGKHRKMHLFDVDIPGQLYFKESDVFTAGDGLQLIRYHGLVLAVLICYDIRFPELARMAALEGAQMLVIPAAFNHTTGPAHWDLLMRTRAVDNQLFVVAASPALNPKANYQAWGHSLVVDPWGTVISEGGSGEEIIYAELDWTMVDKVRRELPLLKHRRTDIYELNYFSR
ncbi:MAG: carbon-nitrogen hydrolase [Firmicutes bacterium HGW-Firmicutes-15]|nr:MAG: carbon-nitrogen hydrolase [Firmicutes bacterium HGW-Firmicutes-15]